jgi:hypothetical protein
MCLWYGQILSASVDSNYRNILDAKRDGLSAVAIRGMSPNNYQLRSADQIFDKLTALRPKDLYNLVGRATKQEEGPQQQPDAVAARDTTRLKSVAAPAQFEDVSDFHCAVMYAGFIIHSFRSDRETPLRTRLARTLCDRVETYYYMLLLVCTAYRVRLPSITLQSRCRREIVMFNVSSVYISQFAETKVSIPLSTIN